ncbi:MAG TPA: hypothetical protein VGH38_27055 [Bryobacteraceae bacterium]|jgi:hypothetical protein
MKIPGAKPFLLLALCLSAAAAGRPDSWNPARWQGGPLETTRRARANTLPADPALRDAIANWYDPATLNLLEGSPVNCLLVTWSTGTDATIERQQQQLLKTYAARAHQRGVSIVGLVYSGTDVATLAASAADARLDALALDGEFTAAFAERVTKALASVPGSPMVIPIVSDLATMRRAKGPIVAVEGVSPSARNLSDMGIRAAPSSEPWIQSNAWLVRSFRRDAAWQPVWIAYENEDSSPAAYARSVADAAMAGGRWIVALDDGLRAGLRAHDPAALATWKRIADTLRFAEDHADWRSFTALGNTAIVVDTAAGDASIADEFLKLVARRQVPYRLIVRSQLTAASLAGFRAVLATELAPPTAGERAILKAFAEKGGQVVVGPSWGDAPKDEPFAEMTVGKGRVVVYKDPDPEAVAKDMRDLLSHKDAGMSAFNVPSVITYASVGADGKRLLVELLNYSGSPSTDITIRVTGVFKNARLFTPEGAPASLEVSLRDGQTDITIPKLALWGGVLLE